MNNFDLLCISIIFNFQTEDASSAKSDISDNDTSELSTGDSSDDESSEEEDNRKQPRNLFDVINTDDDEDDEDYVPKKKLKHVEKHVEKQRIRSPVETPSDIQESQHARPMKVLICCVCLGDIR